MVGHAVYWKLPTYCSVVRAPIPYLYTFQQSFVIHICGHKKILDMEREKLSEVADSTDANLTNVTRMMYTLGGFLYLWQIAEL